MKYETARFGSVEIQDKDILLFPDALYGFDQEKEFVILPLDPKLESHGVASVIEVSGVGFYCD